MMKTALAVLTGTAVLALATPRVDAVAYGPMPPGHTGVRFDRWDRNDDGVIDKGEFKAMARALKNQQARGTRRGMRGRRGAAAKHAAPHMRRRADRGPNAGRRGFADDRGFGRRDRNGGGPGIDKPRFGKRHMRGRQGKRLREMIRAEVHRTMRDMHRGGQQGPQRCPACGRDGSKMRGPRHGMQQGRRGIDAPRDGRPGQGKPGAFGRRHRGPGFGPDSEVTMDRRPRGTKRDGARGPGGRKGIGKRLFKKFDSNHDGIITLDEFPGRPERFERLDRNGDGQIDKSELKRAGDQRRGRRSRDADGPGNKREKRQRSGNGPRDRTARAI